MLQGAQANVWTEYITTEEHLEYMVLPRMAALAEVQWTQPELKDYECFTKRISKLVNLYRRDGFNYAKHIYEIKADYEVDTIEHALNVRIHSIDDAPIYYTLDGSQPTLQSHRCDSVIRISQSADLKAVAIREAGVSKVVERKISFNKATMASVRFIQSQPAPDYTFQGAVTLVDGLMGNDNFSTGAWLGFLQDRVTILLDLHKDKSFSKIGVNAMTYMNIGLCHLDNCRYFVRKDNSQFEKMTEVSFPEETDVKKRDIKCFEAAFNPVEARYVKLIINGSKELPKNHISFGAHPFLFIDELILE